jgi:transposase
MDRAWVGVDVGKEFHWIHVLDASGKEILSRKLKNEEEMRRQTSRSSSMSSFAWQVKSYRQ